MKKIKQKDIIEVFRKKGCNISATCNALGISRQTYYNWLKNDEDLKLEIEHSQEAVLDNVESKLLSAINDGNITAIIFYLKTKGKGRGYVERSELTGIDGQNLFEVKIIDTLENDTDEHSI
jgi:hypothetical protein